MKDTICTCNHWYEEHCVGAAHACGACGCEKFSYCPEYNTVEYIADRGCEHEQPCSCAYCVYNEHANLALAAADDVHKEHVRQAAEHNDLAEEVARAADAHDWDALLAMQVISSSLHEKLSSK